MTKDINTKVVCEEALWHMIHYKDQYNHAMSVEALESALEDLKSQ